MKLLISGLVVLMSLSVYGQEEETYTLRLSTARKLVHDALRSRVLDSIVQAQEQQISILEYQFGKLQATGLGMAQNHAQEIRLEQGKAEDYKNLAEAYRVDADKQRKQKKWIIAGGTLALLLSLVFK